jgi:cell division protein ZapD
VTRYEYPFNESVRTMLRLEHLFDRLGQLIARDAVVDHHFALVTLFEIADVAARADLKSDLLLDLERHRQQLGQYRGNPAVSEAALQSMVERIEQAFSELNQLSGKAGADLTSSEWLMSLRSRVCIPGGTCEFDLPGYYAWQQHAPARRRADLLRWAASLMPLAKALNILLGLVRESGVAQKVMVLGGQFSQGLPVGRSFSLLRVRLEVPQGKTWVPEINGHRLMVSIRLMQQDSEGRLRPCTDDATAEVSLCA